MKEEKERSQLQSMQDELHEARRIASMSLRTQALRENDLKELQERYARILEIARRQNEMLRALMVEIQTKEIGRQKIKSDCAGGSGSPGALDETTESLRSLESTAANFVSLPGLLQQAARVSDEAADVSEQPIRMVHHLACTGGTVISKCIASMPNVYLLSEVDPLSELGLRNSSRFCPTDLIALLRYGTRQPDQALLLDVFSRGVEAIYEDLRRKGQYLVLREHSHSHFCAGAHPASRPTVREVLSKSYPIRSLVTVRHPLDSWLSLANNGWVHFEPKNITEYSKRYLSFLDRHQGCEIIRYEDFVSDPTGSMKSVTRILELPFIGSFRDLFDAHKLSGDSGRRGAEISVRSRRPVDADLKRELAVSSAFEELCGRLGYEGVVG